MRGGYGKCLKSTQLYVQEAALSVALSVAKIELPTCFVFECILFFIIYSVQMYELF